MPEHDHGPCASLQETREAVARQEEICRNLVDWQKRQNGTLQQMDSKIGGVEAQVNRLVLSMLGIALGVVVQLALLVASLLRP